MNYCNVILDGSIRKPLCRFYFNNVNNKFIVLKGAILNFASIWLMPFSAGITYSRMRARGYTWAFGGNVIDGTQGRFPRIKLHQCSSLVPPMYSFVISVR